MNEILHPHIPVLGSGADAGAFATGCADRMPPTPLTDSPFMFWTGNERPELLKEIQGYDIYGHIA